MINIDEAREKVKKMVCEYEIIETRMDDERWIFIFNAKGAGKEKLYPGAPILSVNKESGEVYTLMVPPLKNLQIIKNATVI